MSPPGRTNTSHSLPVESQYYGFETSSASSSRVVRSDLYIDGTGATSFTRFRPLESSYSDLDQSRVLPVQTLALASVKHNNLADHKPQLLNKKKAPQAVDFYPTPPPSPDLLDLDIVPTPPTVISPLVSHASTLAEESVTQSETDWNDKGLAHNTVTFESHNNEYDKSLPVSAWPNNTSTQYKRTTPSIPISLLLNTPHTLPHAAPFKLAHPAGILSALGGNRVLHVEKKSSIFDRMPYSAASTNGLMLTQDQGEEASVEAMLEGSSSGRNPTPMSPDQSRISNIFIHPPTPDGQDSNSGTPDSLSVAESTRPGSRSASPRGSPHGSPMRSANSAPGLPLQVLPEVRSPPRQTLEMTNDSLRLAHQRSSRRPRVFAFTEIPDSSSSSAASSRAVSPDRAASLQTQEAPASMSMGPASSAPGNIMPRRQTYTRAQSDTNLPAHRSHETSLSPLSASSFAAPSVRITPPDRAPSSNGEIHMTSRRSTGLKLDFTGITPIGSSSSSTGTPSAAIPSPYSAKLIRKKSGEILRPALKYAGPLAANGTPLEAPARPENDKDSGSRPRFASKSLPATPSCAKYVHFDSQLERVKLFQKEQKPSVVSRSGSPTGDYTTSEGEEYPFPSTDEEGPDKRDRKVLQINLPNFPTSQPPEADLFLESLFLDDDRKSLKGVVQVRNLAFQKWVAVRFTLDWWQTTSEVTATHKDSVRGGSYDRFQFVIKLSDLLANIEQKTLFLAIRYNTDGREIWDANGGQNYQVQFQKAYALTSRLVPKRSQPTIQAGMGRAIGGRTSQWSVTSGQADDRLADLRHRLGQLEAGDHHNSPPLLSPNSSRHNSFSPQRKHISLDPSTGSPRRSVSAFDARNNNSNGDLPVAGAGLAARYDMNSSLKQARRNSNSPNSRTIDLPEVRTGLLQFGQNGASAPERERGRPSMEFYSPRNEYAKLNSNEGFFSLPPQQQQQHQQPAVSGSRPAVRDHSISPPSLTQGLPPPQLTSVKDHSRTVTIAPPTRISVPEVQVSGPTPDPSPNNDDGPSSQSTSAGTAPPQLEASNESPDETPSDSPRSPPEANMARWSPDNAKAALDESVNNYAHFISQFCWAGAPPAADSPATHMDRPAMERRAHSTSSLDAYFAAHTNPPPHSHNAGSGHMTPTGSSSRSASVASSVNGGGSQVGSYFSTTPVQSTPISNGYFTASSTPTRTVRLPAESEGDDDEDEDEDREKNRATVTAALKSLSTPTLTNTTTTGSRPSTPSAIGLDFGTLDIDMSPRNRGHQSPPVIC